MSTLNSPELPKQPTPARSETGAWLYRPSSIRKLWIGLSLVLALTVAAQLLVTTHGHFGVDGWFGFNAAYGFLSCVGMVLFAKLLGYLIKRPDDYFDRVRAELESAEPANREGSDV